MTIMAPPAYFTSDTHGGIMLRDTGTFVPFLKWQKRFFFHFLWLTPMTVIAKF
jgi:hypothetical protein